MSSRPDDDLDTAPNSAPGAPKEVPPPQFSLGMLLLVMVLVAVGSMAARQLLIAAEVPHRRAVFVVVVVPLPLFSALVVSWLARMMRRWMS